MGKTHLYDFLWGFYITKIVQLFKPFNVVWKAIYLAFKCNWAYIYHTITPLSGSNVILIFVKLPRGSLTLGPLTLDSYHEMIWAQMHLKTNFSLVLFSNDRRRGRRKSTTRTQKNSLDRYTSGTGQMAAILLKMTLLFCRRNSLYLFDEWLKIVYCYLILVYIV